jgi:hypothetical protein
VGSWSVPQPKHRKIHKKPGEEVRMELIRGYCP